MASTPISKVTPDFQSLFTALEQKLQQKQTWVDMLPASVGTTITDLFAGSAVSNQLYLDIAFREAFLPTAVRDSSIFAGTRMLGVNINRKTPSSCTASLTNSSEFTKFIAPYSELTIGGNPFFNREQYTVPPFQTIDNINLYAGSVFEKEFDLEKYDSLTLKEFVLDEPGFTVSTDDLLVYTEDRNTNVATIWTRTDKAIFEHTSTETVYYESTTRDGDTSLLFGDGEYGRALDVTEILKVRYTTTNGSIGNNGLPGEKVEVQNEIDLKGETTTNISGGSDEKSALYYKLFSSNMFRTKRRVISDVDFRSLIMTYPGVADVACTGQRDIAPDDLRWMNMIRICVLPEEQDTWGGANPNPTSGQWKQFLDWLQPKMHDAYTVQKWNPLKVFVPVRAKIAIEPNVSSTEIELIATDNVLQLFQKKPGILGRRLSQSDIVDAIRTIEGVDYVEVVTPEEDIILPDMNRYIILDGNPKFDIVYSERTLGVTGAF